MIIVYGGEKDEHLSLEVKRICIPIYSKQKDQFSCKSRGSLAA